MASAAVHLSLPSSSLFKFPPSNDPRTLPPPAAGSTLHAPPFSISSSAYNSVLDVRVPITIACVYAATVTALNAYNRSAGNKAWPISKTRSFFWFVVAHNVFLAVYSGWTFVGMLAALQRTVQRWNGLAGVVASVDSLCKMHGSSGLGNAVAYTPSLSEWTSVSPSAVPLGKTGTPDPTNLGRLWNEGLAFYGWFFYLSKFYEVLDTAIILAKGKRSSTLQTYHHAGAMMCMWAGIRYMSPPIWMFVFVNSGIHTLMYTYYTLTAFAVPIPQALKRSLTTMQIIQFVVGVFYATIHSFVTYDIPVTVADLEASILEVASAASSTATSIAASASSAGADNLLKKLFRAAGEGGQAESANAANSADHATHTNPSGNGSKHAEQYHTQYQTVSCIDTSGQTFAIWLNVLYLMPLTVLFVRFFIKSYLRRGGQTARKGVGHTTASPASEKSGGDVSLNGSMNGKRNGSMNGYANGGMNGHANGGMNGQANGGTNGYANGGTNGYANGGTNGYANGGTNGYANGGTNGYANGGTNGYANGGTNGYANGGTNGYANGGVNGYANGGMNGKPNGKH